jgi:hypothetical protein
MIEVVSVLVALCLISTVLRVFARLRRRVGFGIDDYLSMGAMFLMIGMLIELILCSSHSPCFNCIHTNNKQGVQSEAMEPTSKN